MRELKFEIMFEVSSRDFTKKIAKHYTTLDRLTDGFDAMDYDAIDIIAKRQFTGLQDINGKDIYEGDVLHQLDPVIWNPFAVYYCADNSCYLAGGTLSKRTIKEYELVIVGNIHENPKLIP